VFLIMLFLSAFCSVSSGLAGGETSRHICFCNELAKSSADWRLYLCAKDPVTWRVLSSGGWGELAIHRPNGRFEFTGHGMRPATDYALVHTSGQSPSGGILACGRADERGELHTSGVWSAWRGKIWLVLGSDLQGKCSDLTPESPITLKAWHPADYLFETETL
jgi:hypothetical protein